MVVIRCTQKFLRRLKPADLREVSSTTRLGDWFANIFGVRQQRYVLLVSERSRLPILLPGRDVKHVGSHLVDALTHVLLSLDVPALVVRRELGEMREAVIAGTNNRSVLGSMNDFVFAVRWHLYDEPDADLLAVSLRLSETPILALGGKSPDLLTREILH